MEPLIWAGQCSSYFRGSSLHPCERGICITVWWRKQGCARRSHLSQGNTSKELESSVFELLWEHNPLPPLKTNPLLLSCFYLFLFFLLLQNEPGALCHWAPSLCLFMIVFIFILFWEEILSRCPGWPQTSNIPASARSTGVCHCARLCLCFPIRS